MYDKTNEVRNRLNNFQSHKISHELRPDIISDIMEMSNQKSVIIQRFIMFKEHFV